MEGGMGDRCSREWDCIQDELPFGCDNDHPDLCITSMSFQHTLFFLSFSSLVIDIYSVRREIASIDVSPVFQLSLICVLNGTSDQV